MVFNLSINRVNITGRNEMKKLLSWTTLALVTLIALVALPVFADGQGKYQAVPLTTTDDRMDGAVWVVDTTTGQVKICTVSQYVRPSCTGWTPNLPSDYKNE